MVHPNTPIKRARYSQGTAPTSYHKEQQPPKQKDHQQPQPAKPTPRQEITRHKKKPNRGKIT